MSKINSNLVGAYVIKTRKKFKMTQMAGVPNDFISKRDLKAFGSLSVKQVYQKKVERDAAFAKQCEAEDNDLEKQIYFEDRFPKVIETKEKNILKYKKTCERRIERLINKEKYFPLVFGHRKNLVGKLAEIILITKYGSSFYRFYIESKQDQWNDETRQYDKNVEIISPQIQSYGAGWQPRIFAMMTGQVIDSLSLKTGKPERIFACQVLLDDKLSYVSYDQLVRV